MTIRFAPRVSTKVGPFNVGVTAYSTTPRYAPGQSPYGQRAYTPRPATQQRTQRDPRAAQRKARANHLAYQARAQVAYDRTGRSLPTVTTYRAAQHRGAGHYALAALIVLVLGFLGLIMLGILAMALHITPATLPSGTTPATAPSVTASHAASQHAAHASTPRVHK